MDGLAYGKPYGQKHCLVLRKCFVTKKCGLCLKDACLLFLLVAIAQICRIIPTSPRLVLSPTEPVRMPTRLG